MPRMGNSYLKNLLKSLCIAMLFVVASKAIAGNSLILSDGIIAQDSNAYESNYDPEHDSSDGQSKDAEIVEVDFEESVYPEANYLDLLIFDDNNFFYHLNFSWLNTPVLAPPPIS